MYKTAFYSLCEMMLRMCGDMIKSAEINKYMQNANWKNDGNIRNERASI